MSDDEGTPWPPANSRRGKLNAPLAREFVKDFPIGTRFMIEDFDNWCWARKLIPEPSLKAKGDKQSDGWKAHLMRRHEVKVALNNAGAHPRQNNGSAPFFIARSTGSEYIVRAPEDEALQGRLARKIQTIVQHHKRQLDYLLQSPDYETLPPEVQSLAEQAYINIDEFAVRLDTDCKMQKRRLENLNAKLKKVGKGALQLQLENGMAKAEDEITLEDLGL